MRVVITSESSEEPAMHIIGERGDLVAFAESLKEEAERARIDGAETTYFTLPELVITSASYDHLFFGLTADLEQYANKKSLQSRKAGWCAVLLVGIGLVVLYLAYRGLSTF